MSENEEERQPVVEEDQEINEDEEQPKEANSLEDEMSEDDNDEEVEEPSAKKEKKKKKRSMFIDDAAEEDEDRRKMKRSRFIDDIAEVSGDDEDDDEDEEGVMDDLIDDADEAATATDREEVRRAMREAERRAAEEEEDINPEELQSYLKSRFGRDRVAAYQASEHGEAAGSAVSQQALMPTARDPKLWVIRCVDGAEREVVICLLQKCYDYAAKGQPLLIKSVFAKDQLKGYLYVEAFKEAHVKEALKGLRNVFNSKPPKLVPLAEMVSAITVPRSATRIAQVGSWVRPKIGVYKGDLAKVLAVDINAGRATIKLVPRLDFAAMAARKAEGRRGFDKAPKVRPVQRAFNPDEARSYQLDVMMQRDRATGDLIQILNNSQRFTKGYLLKTVATKGLALEETLPPLDELQRFNAAQQDGDGDGGGGDLTSLVQELGVEGTAALEQVAANAKFVKGDRVIVREGDLKGILGRVELVSEDGQVMVLPIDDSLGDFQDIIGFAPREISKFFDSGDHVKVVHGSRSGETGMVVKLDDGVCYVLTDATQEEIKVFARDLVEAVSAHTTADRIGDYELFDLAVLDSQTVGVIVGVEADSCRVLTNAGDPSNPDIRVCRLPDLKRKINNRRTTAQDQARNEIGVNDIVLITEGALRDRAGTVKHIMRGFLFIQSREIHDNCGFACVHARTCLVRGGKNRPQNNPLSGIMATPSRLMATPAYGGGGGGGSGGVMASPAHHSAGGGGGYGAAGGGGGGYSGRQTTQSDKQLEGKGVVVKRGPYRGFQGTIKSATNTHVRVELIAQMTTVTIDKAHCVFRDGGGSLASTTRPAMGMGLGMGMGMSGGAGVGISSVYGSGAAAAPGGRTPAHYSAGASATPAHYSSMATATPMYPGMTPGRDAVTKTPAYDPAWAATPAHPGFGGGGSSYADDAPYGGGGGGGGGGGMGAPSSQPTANNASASAMFVPSFGGGGYGSGVLPQSAGGYTQHDHHYSSSGGGDMATAPDATAASGAGGPPPPSSSIAAAAAATPGPTPDSKYSDWVGLEVELPSGEHAAVRSVGSDGQVSVQIGRLSGDVYFFKDGSVHSVPVADLKKVAVAKGDRVRVVAPENYGSEFTIDVIDGNDAFGQVAGKGVILFNLGACAKLAVN